MKIVLYKGNFRYDVVDHFVDGLAEGFESLGFQTAVLKTPSIETAAKELEGARLCVGFNGIGAEMSLNGKPLYNLLGVEYLSFLLDHPVYHIDRINAAFEGMRIAASDGSHRPFLNSILKDRTSLVIPHGGSRPKDGKGILDYSDRDLPILFPGSYLNPDTAEAALKGLAPATRSFADSVAELMLSSDPIDVCEAFAAKGNGVDLMADATLLRSLCPLLKTLDFLVRAKRRLALLAALDEAEIPVLICGDGWPDGLFKNHSIRGAVPFAETLSLMGRSKIVLNSRVSPGTHERVFSSMLCGALCLSDWSESAASLAGEGSVAFYRWTDLASAAKLAGDLLESPDKAARIAQRGEAEALARHQWSHRAEAIAKAMNVSISGE